MLAVYCRCRIRLRQDPSWYWYHVEVSHVGTAVVSTAHLAPAHLPRSLRVFELKVRWYTQGYTGRVQGMYKGNGGTDKGEYEKYWIRHVCTAHE